MSCSLSDVSINSHIESEISPDGEWGSILRMIADVTRVKRGLFHFYTLTLFSKL